VLQGRGVGRGFLVIKYFFYLIWAVIYISGNFYLYFWELALSHLIRVLFHLVLLSLLIGSFLSWSLPSKILLVIAFLCNSIITLWSRGGNGEDSAVWLRGGRTTATQEDLLVSIFSIVGHGVRLGLYMCAYPFFYRVDARLSFTWDWVMNGYIFHIMVKKTWRKFCLFIIRYRYRFIIRYRYRFTRLGFSIFFHLLQRFGVVFSDFLSKGICLTASLFVALLPFVVTVGYFMGLAHIILINQINSMVRNNACFIV
jgi:hypothetical protein